MLEQGDLKQIKEVVDSSFEDFAIVVNKGFQEVDKRFDKIDERFEDVDRRFDGIDKRLDGIDKRLDLMQKELSVIKSKLSDVEIRLAKLENKVEAMSRAGVEDVAVMNNDIVQLRQRVQTLEKEIEFLQSQKV